MKTLFLDIITPQGAIYSGEVVSVQAPGTSGSFEVLANHAPMITTLTEGTVKVTTTQNQTTKYKISSGVCEVLRNNVVVLAEKLSKI